jgi:hypothetical protein
MGVIKMICKIKINKTDRTEDTTTFNYPQGYEGKDYRLIYYQNEGLTEEYALATTDLTSSSLPEGITELSKVDAETILDEWIDADKDLIEFDEEKFNSLEELKQSIKDIKKAILV